MPRNVLDGSGGEGTADMAGLKVRTSELLSGSKDVTKLQDRCATVGADAVGVLAEMVARAGHLAVASALSRTASLGATTYVAAAEVYQHISQNLSGSAGTYETAEQGVAHHDPTPVPAVSLAASNCDADALYGYATRLEMAAASAAGLGAETPKTIGSIHQKTAWTGPGAAASLALGEDLGRGVAATAAPLVTIAAAVRAYAGALDHAQAMVSAYNRSAADAELADGSDQGANAVQAAACDAQAAVSACLQAGDLAASQIASAAAQLGGVFTAGKPVRSYLASLAGQVNAHAVRPSTQITAATPTPNLVFKTPGVIPVPTAVDLLIGDGLPLATPKPLILPRHVDGPVNREGPLALDYRSWLDQNGHLVRPGTTSSR
jgi:uncharacterized protein YukE